MLAGDLKSVTGTDGPDVIVALGRYDSVWGGAGDDIICLTYAGWASGDSGDDLLIGSSEADTLYGGPGDDVLRGNRGEDTLSGGDGRDRMYGGGRPANDYFIADPGDDTWIVGASTQLHPHDPWAHNQLTYPSTGTGVVVDLSGPVRHGWVHAIAHGADIGHDRIRFRAVGTDFITPTVLGTPAHDDFVCSSGINYFIGNGGNDTVSQCGRNDRFEPNP